MPAPAKQPRRKPGSQPALRRQNTQRVVETLAQRGPTTQAKLARLTGLSTGTISNIVRELGAEDRITSTPVIDSGRRAMQIALTSDDRVCVGADLSDGRLRLLLCRLDHRVLASDEVDLDHASPTDQLRTLRRMIDTQLGRLQLTTEQVIAAVIGLPPATSSTEAPLWDEVDTTRIAEVTFGFEVSFEPAAGLGALAQVSWGPYGTTSSLAHLQMGPEPAVGLVVENQLWRGHVGAAGRIAHLPIAHPGDICRCGNRGCLQTVASSEVIVRQVARAKHARELSESQVVALAQQRDLATLRVLDDAGLALGQALAAVCTVANPATVVVGGALAEAGAPLIDPISRGFSRRAMPAVAQHTTITRCHLGPLAAAKGAAAVVARRAAAAAL